MLLTLKANKSFVDDVRQVGRIKRFDLRVK